ncbi:MAG: glycerol dehydrogenase [Oscillospiraceae bacterium]
MNKILSSPGKFVIGRGEIANLAQHVEAYGTPLMLVAHKDDSDRVRTELAKVEADGIQLIESNFGGECTRAEIDRVRELCRKHGCKAVIGLGGGKAIDTAKTIANDENIPSVIVPTIASTDAPCSKLAVLYDEDHVLVETLVFPKNPDVVIVDSAVIAKAPVRFLVAGMGDAYATYYEGRACIRSSSPNYNKSASTNTAFAMAKECLRILLEDSERALLACKAKVVTPALENIIEANILLSGIGFESVGLAGGHALHGAFTALPETHEAMHGEKVAVGTLVQLILENAPMEEMIQTYQYYHAVGLPTTLEDIGIKKITEEKLRIVAARSARAESLIHHLPFPVTEDMVYDALICLGPMEKAMA